MQQSLAPHLYQSLEILQMPILNLQQMVRKELDENPTLEMVQPAADVQVEVEQGTRDTGPDLFDNELESLAMLNGEWNPDRQTSAVGDAGEKHRFMIDSLSKAVSLQEQLQEQLAMARLNEQESAVAELVIGSIDDDGYLSDMDELMQRPDVPADLFERIVATIQEFEPAGVCARDLRECLMLQLDRAGERGSPAYRLVSEHLDMLGRNRIEEIAKLMTLSLTEIQDIARRIAQLDPRPGRQCGAEQIEYITPEIFVEKKGGEYVIMQNHRSYPELFINQKYLQMLKDRSTPKEAQAYIREKLAKSRQMIQSIDQRLSMIHRIAIKLVRVQHDFFEEGVSSLHPLNMKTMADMLDVHETTVSRATSGKYMQTPRGLISMKYFFRPSVRSVSGRVISNESAKALLAEIVQGEDRRRPCSDAKLVEQLKGYDVAISRRTVSKYRSQLRIPASHLRRER